MFLFVLLSAEMASASSTGEVNLSFIEEALQVSSARKKELVGDWERKTVDVLLNDCTNSTLKDQLECSIEVAKATCKAQKTIPVPDCLSGTDIFTSLVTGRKWILDGIDIWRIRRAQSRDLADTLIQAYVRHAVNYYNAFEAMAIPGTQKDEAKRLAQFCLGYSRFQKIPASLCLALTLRGKMNSF